MGKFYQWKSHVDSLDILRVFKEEIFDTFINKFKRRFKLLQS